MYLRLTPTLVLNAYRSGFFPMADSMGIIRWYSPDPRAIFELERFKPSRSLRKVVQSGQFEVRVDSAFDAVIAACAERDEGTWISPTISRLYRTLHRMGAAHSVETWMGGQLVGGLYGIALGGAFFGESMFHRATDASKVALVALIERMKQRGFTLLDTQFITPHLARLGAIEIPRAEYMQRLSDALRLECRFG